MWVLRWTFFFSFFIFFSRNLSFGTHQMYPHCPEGTVLCCTVLNCTVFYYTVLYCTVLYCSFVLTMHSCFAPYCSPWILAILEGIFTHCPQRWNHGSSDGLVILLLRFLLLHTSNCQARKFRCLIGTGVQGPARHLWIVGGRWGVTL